MSRRAQYIAILLLALVPTAFGILCLSPVFISRVVIAFAFLLTGYAFLGIAYLILRPLYNYSRENALQKQVEVLLEGLKQAGEISTALEAEIHGRTSELERLKVQSAVAKKILSELTQEEYDAVVAAIHAQSRKRELKQLAISFLLGAATNIFTFLILESRWW